MVLVGQDGVQRPPLHFPRGGHLLAFLSCVETGLMPLGHLEPPLWYENGTGKSCYTVSSKCFVRNFKNLVYRKVISRCGQRLRPALVNSVYVYVYVIVNSLAASSSQYHNAVTRL